MNSVPLADVLPWGNDPAAASASSGGAAGRTYLVTDSVECDGRFVLYSLASTFLSSPSSSATKTSAAPGTGGRDRGRRRGRVAWVSCGSPPLLERHVRSALKRMGCGGVPAPPPPASAASSSSSSSSSSWLFVPVASEVASSLSSPFPPSSCPGAGEGEGDVGEMMSEYVKCLYRRLRDWAELAEGEAKDAPASAPPPGPCLVVLDDVSCLASLFGENMVYALVQRLRHVATTSSTSTPNGGGCVVVLRCSNDSEAERAVVAAPHSPSSPGGIESSAPSAATRAAANVRGRWVGAGGDVMPEEEEGDAAATCWWEGGLVELADGIVDVVPLQSGFSREAHGRLIFTERMGGRGWRSRTMAAGVGGVDGGGGGRERDDPGHRTPRGGRDGSSSAAAEVPTVVNYVCGDQGVRAIRLRSGK